MSKESTVVQLVWVILREAIKRRASLIAIDHDREQCFVSYRIDGADHVSLQPPIEMHPFLIARVCVLADIPVVGPLPRRGHFEIVLGTRIRRAFELELRQAEFGGICATLSTDPDEDLPV